MQNFMKTPSLLFSLPFLLTVLAAQAGEVTATRSEETRSGGAGNASTVSASTTQTSAGNASGLPGQLFFPSPEEEASTASLSPESIAASKARAASFKAPEIPVPGPLTRVRYRGKYHMVDISTDELHVRGRKGKQAVAKVSGVRDAASLDLESARMEKATGVNVDLIAYPPGRPKTDANKMLLTKRVVVRLAQGVTHSVFAATTGALRAQRMPFAKEALVLSYPTTMAAAAAVEELRARPGVLDAELVIATLRSPEFVPTDAYFSPGGGAPANNPTPLTDNVNTFVMTNNPSNGYQWWADNKPTLVGPLNSVAARIDLGDYPPIGYAAGFPLLNGEQADIRLPLAWENISTRFNSAVSGRGIRVLIIDDGIDGTHPDLQQALDLVTTRHRNFFSGTNSPAPEDLANDSHGTSLAGIVGARIKLSQGMAGIAPLSTLQSAVAIRNFVDELDWAQAFTLGSTLVDSDADNDYLDEKRGGANNMFYEVCLNASSESGSRDATDLVPETWYWRRAIQFGATKGRAFKGVVYVASAGNGGDGHNDTNYMEIKNSIFQITVGSCSELGRRIARSNPGCNVVCVAPSWGDELPPLLNWSGSPGGSFGNRPIKVNPPLGPDNLPSDWRRVTQGITTLRTNKGYTAGFTGTSASAGMVAGIAALMLEKNPDLSARDVKEILLRSGRVNNDVRVTYDGKVWPTQWRMGSLGRPLHPVFGAGLVDANKALKIAEDWPGLPPNPLPPLDLDVEVDGFGKTTAMRNTETGGLYLPLITNRLIPLDGTPVVLEIQPPPSGMRLEEVEVRVQLYHARRGDLEIKLVAPGEIGWEQGREMESVLYTPHRDDYTESKWSTEELLKHPTDWTFTTLRHWGSRPTKGTPWKLIIRDAVNQGATLTPTVNDPVYVPVGNPTDPVTQRITGVGVTYHGTFSKQEGIDPPVVKAGSFNLAPGTTLNKIQLVASGLGEKKGGGVLYPVINWDLFNTVDIVPMQPSNLPWEFLGHFPPAMALNPAAPDNLTPLDPPGGLDLWPNQPLAPTWVPWQFSLPESGPQGGLTSQPAWGPNLTPVEESADHTFIVVRDPANTNAQTNFIHLRLDRALGKLEIIPFNKGLYKVSVFAESLIGMSAPKVVEIKVATPGYSQWTALYWSGADLQNPEITGFDKDPDGDGIPNGLEFAMGFNPTVVDAAVPASRVEGNEIVFTFRKDVAASGTLTAGVVFENSDDLSEWTAIAPTILAEANGIQDLEVRVPLTGNRRFYRLKAY